MPELATPKVDISRSLLIGGWMSENELLWLATQAQSHPYIVEFGSLHGRSTRAMADNLPSDGKLWAVDPWTGEYYFDSGRLAMVTTYVMPYFIKNLKEHIDTGHVVPVRAFSYQFSLPVKVDMVFIDGDHRYETVVKDIKKAHELVRPGGLICGHDYDHPEWPGVKKAVHEYVNGNELQLIEETIWATIKS